MAKKKKPDPTTMAYSYLRFSSGEQASGDSIRRQTGLRDAWIGKMGVTLDTSVSLRDEGVSAFSGKHRDNPDSGALAAFLHLVRQGRIPRGSYLIVENLDRLTREHIRPALTLLLNLIEAGIRVVQLLPVEQVFDEDVEPMTLMMAIMELSRGHSESKMKSERIGAAWAAKKRQAAIDKKPMTPHVPAWLRVEDGEFVLVPDGVAAVRRIFQLATDGHGILQIARRLLSDGVQPIGKVPHWNAGYVGKILRNRAVIGEHQPTRTDPSGKVTTDGPPIVGFFPPVLTVREFELARGGIVARTRKAGRISKVIGLFSGLLRDARDGGTLTRKVGGEKKSPHPLLMPYRVLQGRPGAKSISFPLGTFEAALVSQLREVDPREILPPDGAVDEVGPLTGKLADIDTRIEKLKAKLLGGREIDSVVDVLRTLDAERKTTAGHLAAAREKAAHPLTTAWSDVGTLAEALATAPDQAEARTRLRAAIRRIVLEVWCLFVPRGRTRLAAVQVWFEGGRHRDYLIVHRAACGPRAGNRVARWSVRSLPPGRSGELDLRDREQATRLEKVLGGLDVKSLEG